MPCAGNWSGSGCETVYAQRLLPYVFEHYAAHLELERLSEGVTHRPQLLVAKSPIYL